jgi:uncharacterized protein with PIN domain
VSDGHGNGEKARCRGRPRPAPQRGRGSGHPARLNVGDCFAYALARVRNLPLLFKGDDFIHTDIQPALTPG